MNRCSPRFVLVLWKQRDKFHMRPDLQSALWTVPSLIPSSSISFQRVQVFERIVLSCSYKAKAIIITWLICSICANAIRRPLSWDSQASINNGTAWGKSDLKPISHSASIRVMAGPSVIHAAAATTTSLPQSAPRAKKQRWNQRKKVCRLQLSSQWLQWKCRVFTSQCIAIVFTCLSDLMEEWD